MNLSSVLRASTTCLGYLLSYFFLCASSVADSSALGAAQQFNAFIRNDFTSQYTDSQGKLFAGGNITLNGYGVASTLESAPQAYTLVSGGDIIFDNGKVYAGGILAVGDTSNISASVRSGMEAGAQVTDYASLPFDYNAAFESLEQLSLALSQASVTGTVEYKWGGVYMKGDCVSEVQVFDLDGATVFNSNTFAIDCVPENATLIFNLSGQTAGFKNVGLSHLQSYATRTIYNFYEATSVDFVHVGMKGSILAPFADLVNPRGHVDGTVIAKSWNGPMELHHFPFTGDLSVIANNPPIIVSAAIDTGYESTLYNYDVEATDEDLPTGDVLTHSLVSAPQGVQIDSNTGVISWDTPPAEYVGTVAEYNEQCFVVPAGSISVVEEDEDVLSNGAVFVSPLFRQVTSALESAAEYTARESVEWDMANNCLGCHVQTQSLLGLETSIEKVDVDEDAIEYLLNELFSNQQANGTIVSREHRTSLLKTQTSLALWSLSSYPDKARTLESRVNALNFLLQVKSVSGDSVYWVQDHNTGWVNNSYAITAIVAQAGAALLDDLSNQDIVLDPEQEQVVLEFNALVNDIANFFLAGHDTPPAAILHSTFRLMGLSEIRPFVTDQNLIESVDNAISFLDDYLRSQQTAEGGWTRYTYTTTESPIVSAWVGIALNYAKPELTDPVVTKNIEYLLRVQNSANGTWSDSSGLFTRSLLGPTSLVMAYLPVALDFLGNPDLNVAKVTLEENAIEDNGRLTLSAVIANRGIADVESQSIVSFYSGVDANGTLLGSTTIEGILSGQQLTTSIVLDDSSILGNNVFVSVQPKEEIDECEIRNNGRRVAIINSQVTDRRGLFDTQIYALNIEDINEAPVITSANEIEISSAQSINHVVDVTDGDIGDAANFELNDAPEGLFIDPRTGRLISDSNVLQAGTYTFDVIVTDLRGAQVTQTISLTINQNLPPVIISEPVSQGQEYQEYNYQVVATDPDNDELTYSFDPLREGFGVDVLSGDITSNDNQYLESLRGANQYCERESFVEENISASLKWEWSEGTGSPIFGPVVVIQLTDDNNDGFINTQDNPDVVFNSGTSNNLVAISGDTGTEIWKHSSVDVAGLGSPSAADIDGDGFVEIVSVSNTRNEIYAFEHTGELKWAKPAPGPTFSNPRDAITIADLDADGDVELVLGRAIFNHEGNLIAEGSGAYGGETNYGIISIVADINLDGDQEIIAANTVYDYLGNTVWQNNSLPATGFNAVGNFDDDEFPEIVLVSSGQVYLLESNGTIIWQRTIPGGGQGGAPTIADVDRDGEPEIGVAGAANYIVLETDGTIKWSVPSQDISSNRTGSSVFDFEGDGKSEVVYADELQFRIFDGETGRVRYTLPNFSGTTLEYPVIADIDNDGAAEVLFGGSRTPTLGLFALEAENSDWVATRSIWNQHAYHINNINDDGTVPVNEVNSWLTHNTYRLNTFSDRSALSGFDLAPFSLTYNDELETLSVEVHNRGLAPASGDILVEFFSGDAETGLKLDEITISNILSADFQKVSVENISTDLLDEIVTAKVTYIGSESTSSSECLSINNIVSAAVLTIVAADPAGLSDAQTYLYSTINANDAPEISNAATSNVDANSAYTFTFTVDDIDLGDAHRFSLVNSPEGISINAITGEVFAEAGVFNTGINSYTVVVEDLAGETDEQVHVLTVSAPDNLPPQFTSTELTTVNADTDYIYEVTAIDPDGDDVIFILSESPVGMFIDGVTGVIYWSPSAEQIGLHIVDVAAVDTNGAQTSQRFALTVLDLGETNSPPSITSLPSGAVVAGKTFTYSLLATDPDGDALTYRLEDASAGMSIDSNGVFTWLPSGSSAGTIFTVSLIVDDQRGGTATQTVSLPVNESANNPPAFTSSPEIQANVDAPYQYQVTGTDSDGDSFVISLDASPNGMTIDADGLIEWIPASSQTSQVFDVVVRLTDARGAASTQSYSIGVNTIVEPNIPPSIASSPKSPAIIGDLYTYVVIAADADGDTLSYNLLTAPLGMSISSSGTINWTPVDGQLGSYPIVIGVSDGKSAVTQSYTLQAVEPSASNNYPAISSNPKTETHLNINYSYAVVAQDPDGDDLTYTLVNAPEGMTINESGVVDWAPTADQVGIADVVIRVSDGQLSIVQSFSIRVSESAPPLEVFVSVSPAVAEANEDITVTVLSSGGTGDVTLNVLFDGAPVTLDDLGQTVVSTGEFGLHSIVATATTSDETDEYQTNFLIRNGNDSTPPVVNITGPDFDSVITAPTEIIGNVLDDNLVSYEVFISPAGKQNWSLIASGDSQVIDSALANFDPTLLVNGQYDVAVQALDVNNQVGSDSIRLIVEDDLKVGNFSFTLEDLNIPLAGIPIQVSRTYDSRRRQEPLDFGYGWTIDYQNVKIEESRTPGFGWTINEYRRGPFNLIADFCVEPLGAPIVTVTLPNGDIEKFEVGADPHCTTYAVFRDVELTLTPVGDTQSTLEIIDGGGFGYLAGDNLVDTSNFSTAIDPNRYKLTTQAGYEYYLSQEFGIQKIIDPNGYTITYTNDGIFHSSGKSIQFVRASDGRITSIIDPQGNALTYQYDEKNDLTSATARDGGSSTYTYNNSHGLLDMFDALGRRIVKNIYDDAGRLIAQEDSDGNRTEFNHDIEGRFSLVTDRNGNNTQLFYDDRGNVLTQVNALDEITTFTFDENNNQLSITNALGETTSATFNERNDQLTQTDALGHVTTYAYNTRGQETVITDAKGNVFNNTYDSVGNLLSVEDPQGNIAGNVINIKGLVTKTTDVLGNTTEFTYDDEGNKLTETDAEGNTVSYTYDENNNPLTQSVTRTVNGISITETTSFEYDKQDRVVKTTDHLGNVTQTEYNLAGQEVANIDALGRRTEMDYDAYNRLLETRYPDGSVETKTYDPEGNMLTETDRLGRITTYEYDALNRQIRVTFADNSFVETIYDAAGRVSAEVDANGNVTEHEYDAAGRKILTRDAQGNEFTFDYDEEGNLTLQIDALGRVMEYTYNALDQRVQTVFDNNSVKTDNFDALSRRTSMTDQANVETLYEYDKLGRLIKVTDALLQETTYSYDEAGNKLTQTDAEGRTTSWEYDALGRVVKRTLPMGEFETMAYDEVGNMNLHTNFNGDELVYAYDEMNRVITISYADGSSELFSYDLNGNRIEAIQNEADNSQRITSYQYDLRDRLVQETQANGAILNYVYDDQGNRTQVSKTINGVTALTDYTYDSLNRLEAVTEDGNTTSYGYDEVGNRTSVLYANGASEVYAYDNLNRLTRKQSFDSSGALVQEYNYTLGETGRRNQIDELSGRSTQYTYDLLYRLTRESITDATHGDYLAEYEYDKVGNRIYETVDGVQTQYSYNDNDWLTQSGGAEYTYDANGSTLTETLDGIVTSYTYSTKNKVESVSKDGATTNYLYNVDGIRTAQVSSENTTDYVVDSNRDYAQVLVELINNSVEVSYVYGDDLISQNRVSETYYYHYDGLGSVRGLTDVSGSLTDTYDYEAFGELLNSTGDTENDYKFTGEQYDANLDQYYLRARYYDQGVGRFTQMDTWMGRNHDPITLNKYLYAHADPGNRVDPTGNFAGGIGGQMSALSIQGSLTTMSVGRVAVVGFAANDAAIATGVGLTSKQAGILAIAAMGASGAKLYDMLTSKEDGENEEEKNETYFHGTTSNAASKIVGKGFRDIPTFFAEDIATARHFGNERAATTGARSVTVIELKIPTSIRISTGMHSGIIGEELGLPFVDVPGSTGREWIINNTGGLQVLNGAILTGKAEIRRLR